MRRPIQVDGRQLWTLFDTGARNTYVLASALSGLTVVPLKVPRKASLGGKVHAIDRACFLEAVVEGKPVEGDAVVIDEIGLDEEGRAIEVLFGALLMQKWGIKVCPETESLDLTHYPKEFVEFMELRGG
ncbi:MAG: hypothetical protein HY720_15250 [Planctomycetes bacterium]|nr:hypothetical protein [Planctomycetota bacterium]